MFEKNQKNLKKTLFPDLPIGLISPIRTVNTKPIPLLDFMQEIKLQSTNFRENETFLKSYSDGPKRDKGQLFLILDLPDNPGAEDSLAEKIWRSLHDSFFNCESDDPYFCFEEALKAVNTAIDQENLKRETGTIGRLHAIASLLQEGTLHFSHAGQAVLYLKRGDQFSRISEELGPDSESGFHSISSGALTGDDCVVFSTRHLPFDENTLLEVFTEKGLKLVNSIKGLAKLKELTGMISHLSIPGNTLEQESLEGPAVSEAADAGEISPVEEEPALRTPETRSRKKAHRVLESIKTKLRTGQKINAAKKAAKEVISGVGSRFSKVLKKPERIKHVNRRYILLGVIALVVVLGALLVYQSGYREKQAEAAKYDQLLYQVKTNIEVAENRFLIGEKTDASDFLNKAAAALQQIETAGFYQSDVEKMKREIALYRDNFDAVMRAPNPNVLADLSTRGATRAVGMVRTEDLRNIIYESGRVFEVFLDSVYEPREIDVLDPGDAVIAGWELLNFRSIAMITQNGRLIEYNMRNGTFEQMNTLDTTWNKGVDLRGYHNGESLYLLDVINSTIWRYPRLRTNYGQPVVWARDTKLSDAVGLAIDGDIYVLTKSGEILRFRRGQLSPFEIVDQPSVALKNPSRIITFQEALHLYVLDSANRRVVVYTKGQGNVGRYSKQILFENFQPNEILDIAVDKEEQKLTVLTRDKLYITDL